MYPVDYSAVEAGDRSNGLGWAGVFFPIKVLLALPHLLIVNVLGSLANVVAYIGFFFVAFTGELPAGLRDILVAALRWQVRVWTWIGAISDEYPPFTLEEVDYPATLKVEDPEKRSTGLAVAGIFLPVKVLFLLPHLIVLSFVWIGAFFATWIGFFIIAFTGRSSPGIHDFLAGTIRWSVRAFAWLQGLTDEYPPFRLAS